MTIGTMTTLARPYAVAAFEYALAKSALLSWENVLKNAAMIAADPDCTAFLLDPAITQKQQFELFCDILKSILDEGKRNFLHLLANNKRLLVLPDIAQLFSELRQQHEKIASVVVTSAFPLDPLYQKKLEKSLAKRLQQHILLTCEVDPALLGGAMIRSGDMVIDGSVRGKLNRLLESL